MMKLWMKIRRLDELAIGDFASKIPQKFALIPSFLVPCSVRSSGVSLPWTLHCEFALKPAYVKHGSHSNKHTYFQPLQDGPRPIRQEASSLGHADEVQPEL